jgi:hypothetical protein
MGSLLRRRKAFFLRWTAYFCAGSHSKPDGRVKMAMDLQTRVSEDLFIGRIEVKIEKMP